MMGGARELNVFSTMLQEKPRTPNLPDNVLKGLGRKETGIHFRGNEKNERKKGKL